MEVKDPVLQAKINSWCQKKVAEQIEDAQKSGGRLFAPEGEGIVWDVQVDHKEAVYYSEITRNAAYTEINIVAHVPNDGEWHYLFRHMDEDGSYSLRDLLFEIFTEPDTSG
jgi:hypothetical protein